MDQMTPTVFVVDDDEEVRNALKLLLESVGLPVICYASALDYLESFNEKLPGCLVVDIRMPGMSGLDMQEKLAERPIHPPVIIITGHGDVPMAVRAVQAGAVDFIEKPFNDEELLDELALQRVDCALDEVGAIVGHDDLDPVGQLDRPLGDS